MNRRSFFQLAVGAAVAPLVPKPLLAMAAPTPITAFEFYVDPSVWEYQRRLIEFCEIISGAQPHLFRTISGSVGGYRTRMEAQLS